MNSHFGRYRVLHKLGQGAMSAVFLARDPVLSRLVAVKVLHQDLTIHRPVLDRFFKEAKIAARIRSPHVVEVYDFGQEGRNPFLVLEFIDGRSVQQVLDQLDGRPLDPIVAAALISQAAEGLAVAAEAGVVHRDLKPDNLMLSENGYLKITDFGISHLAEHTMTRTGQVLGSPRFMSPEQVKGVKPITFQSDMFSLGAVLFYFLSGRTPFQAATMPELHRQITEEPHPSLLDLRPDADPILTRLVDLLLHKKPDHRGDGPRWLLMQLRTYLYGKRVIDPVERVAAYARELSSYGIQTTCNLDRSAIRQYMGSFDLDKSPGHPSRWKRVLILSLVLGAIVGGMALLMIARGKTGRGIPPQAPKVAAPVINRKAQQEPTQTAPPLLSSQAVITKPTGTIPPMRVVEVPIPVESGEIDRTSDAVISILTAPPFATVSIDGHDYGKTPLQGRTLPAGSYRIILKPKVGRTIDTVLNLGPGPQIHRFTLVENPEARSE